MAGSIKPDNVGEESTWVLNSCKDNYGCIAKNLFDGNTSYEQLYSADNYIDITFNNNCNVWVLGTSDSNYSNRREPLKVEKFDGNKWIFYANETRPLDGEEWSKTLENVPAGRYKFSWIQGYRYDIEWYIENTQTDKIIKKWSNDLTNNLTPNSFTSFRYRTGRYPYKPCNAFDNHLTHEWYCGFVIGAPNKDKDWLKIDFINPVQPSKITIQANDDLALPKKIKISMSNDDSIYDEIDIIDNIINDTNVNEYIYKKPNKKYRYLKIFFLEFYKADWLEINQIQLFEKIQSFKYLLKQDDKYYTIKSEFYSDNKFQPISIKELTKENINKYSFKDLNSLLKEIGLDSNGKSPLNCFDNNLELKILESE